MSALARGTWKVVMLVALCISAAGQDAEEQPVDCPPADGQPCNVDGNQLLPSALQDFDHNVIYGATIVEGFISARDTTTASNQNLTRTTSTWLREAYTAVRPYIALNFHRGRTQLTFQSAPIITYVPPRIASFSINGFVDPYVDFSLELSPRLVLNVSGKLTYGDQLSQLLVLTPTTPRPAGLSRSGGADAISASANSSAHAFTSAQFAVSGQGGLEWRLTNRQELSFQIGKVYSTVPGEASAFAPAPVSNVNMARGQFTEQVTPSLDLFAYSQMHQISSAGYACTVTGGGLGFQKEYGQLTSLSGKAGPEYGNPGCNSRLGVSYSVDLQRLISQRSALDVAATRGVDTFYAPGNTWVTSIAGVFNQQISGNTSLEVSGGYLQGSHSYNPEAGYSGFFVAPRLLRRVNDDSSFTMQYGHLSSARGLSSALGRDWISLGWLWHPNRKSF